MKSSKLAETPYFFSVTAQDKTFQFAAFTEEDRAGWIKCFKQLAVRFVELVL